MGKKGVFLVGSALKKYTKQSLTMFFCREIRKGDLKRNCKGIHYPFYSLYCRIVLSPALVKELSFMAVKP